MIKKNGKKHEKKKHEKNTKKKKVIFWRSKKVRTDNKDTLKMTVRFVHFEEKCLFVSFLFPFSRFLRGSCSKWHRFLRVMLNMERSSLKLVAPNAIPSTR